MAITALAELRDVGAGNERLVAGTGDDDHADLGIGLVGVEDLRQRLPHVDGHRVVPGRLVENDPAEGTFLADDHPLGDALQGGQCVVHAGPLRVWLG